MSDRSHVIRAVEKRGKVRERVASGVFGSENDLGEFGSFVFHLFTCAVVW